MKAKIIISLYINAKFADSKIEDGEFANLDSAKDHGRIMWTSMPEGDKQILIIDESANKVIFYKDNFNRKI